MVLLNKKGETVANFFLRASGALRLGDMWWHDDIPPSTAERPLKSYFLANEKGETIANFFLEPPRASG